MKSTLHKYFIFFSFCIMLTNIPGEGNGSPQKSVLNPLDSLREEIQNCQDSLLVLEKNKSQKLQNFKRVNDQIYKLKQEPNQPLLQFRLQNALKSSREIADFISELDRHSQKNKTRLQIMYHEIIKQIDDEIQKRMNEKSSPNRIEMSGIQKLRKEKLFYMNMLQTLHIDEQEWLEIKIDPDDTPERIRMKTMILKDKLAKLERYIAQENEKLVEFKKEQKVQNEMLNFYQELSRSVEDEQEIFDRNRIEEVKDNLENIATKVRELEIEILNMKVSSVNLKEKIKQFEAASETDR